VRMDSSHSSAFDSMILASAGILSPAWRTRMSPGTTYFAGMSISLFSLITFACGEVRLWRASIAFSARNFWMKLTAALITTIVRMTVASVTCPNAYAIAAAAIKMMIIRSKNSFMNSIKRGVFLLVWIMLKPCSLRLCSTAFWSSPSGVDSNSS